MLMEIQEQKIVSGCKNPFRTFYIAVMLYGVWLLIFAKGADANEIAEKPSVSRAIAEVIGAQEREDGYLRGADCMVSWCFGHLAEYVSPDAYDEKFHQWRYADLPIIPKDWKVAVSDDKKDRFYILKRLLNSPEIEYVVNACDAGREGELIFKHVYDLSGSKKPLKRLWISSLEDSAIQEGMRHLKSGE